MLMEVIRDQLIIKDELRSVMGWYTLKLEDHVFWKHERDCEIPSFSGWGGEACRGPHTQPARGTNVQQSATEEEPTTLREAKSQSVGKGERFFFLCLPDYKFPMLRLSSPCMLHSKNIQ